MQEVIEKQVEELAADRRSGADAIARRALRILAEVAPTERAAVGNRIASLHPAMPAIAGLISEALKVGDPLAVLAQADAERRRVAVSAAAELADAQRVATISNSFQVRAALLIVRPPQTLVVVSGPDDEGHAAVTALHEAGLEAIAVSFERLDADTAVVGCDAVFDDSSFVNRRGTARLVTILAPGPVFVLGHRWKRQTGPAPATWPEPGLFEIVPFAPNLRIIW